MSSAAEPRSQLSFGTRGEMILPVSKYYDVNRTLLLVSGLWPYQKSKLRNIQAAFFLTITLSFIVFQLTTFMSMVCTINLVTKVLSIVLPLVVCLLMYTAFFFNSEKMKLLLDLIWHHWAITRDKPEIAILERYAGFTRRFTLVIIQLFGWCISVITLGHTSPIILDVVAPLNTSRPRHLYILMEHFVDRQRYFPLILLHTVVAMSAASVMTVSAGTILMAYMLHACAMLKIASYRIGSAASEISIASQVSQGNRVICQKIIRGVRIHQKAIEFTELILSDFKVPYFIIIGVGVASLAINMFQVFIVLSENNLNEIVTSILFVIMQFSYLYVASYAGQVVADHYTNVFDATYYSNWYTAPLGAQKTLLFIMQRTSKNFYFVFGGIFAVSLKGFSTLASMSISYFTVIYSLMFSN